MSLSGVERDRWFGVGLRAGLPALVCSVFADQPFWGRCVKRARVGTTMRYYARSRVNQVELHLESITGDMIGGRCDGDCRDTNP